MAGSSAAEIDIPNRLIGSRPIVCAQFKSATDPDGSRLARTLSTYALSWTIPRLMKTGTKLIRTLRTCAEVVFSEKWSLRAKRKTVGT
jgi:hypothetical protein